MFRQTVGPLFVLVRALTATVCCDRHTLAGALVSMGRLAPMVPRKSDWYRDRADECDRKAVASRTPTTRANHLKDRDGWRAIADSIDAKERSAKSKRLR